MSDATLLKGVNHVTLCVSDLARSLDFYQRLLGCVLRAEWARGAYLEAGSLWLCLELPAAPFILSRPDDSHLALTVDACGFAILRDRLTGQVRLWKENTSEGDSLYFLDPDGHKLEIHVGSLATRLAAWHL